MKLLVTRNFSFRNFVSKNEFKNEFEDKIGKISRSGLARFRLSQPDLLKGLSQSGLFYIAICLLIRQIAEIFFSASAENSRAGPLFADPCFKHAHFFPKFLTCQNSAFF